MKRTFLLPILLFPAFAFAQQATVPPAMPDSLQSRWLFKVDFMAPVTGNFTIGYEQAVSRSISLDFQVGIIGLGVSQSNYPQALGFFIKAGPCLYFTPNYEEVKSRNFSRFQGTYIKPTLAFSNFTYNGDYGFMSDVSVSNTTGAFLLNIGHQFVFDRILSFNFYGGIGYYFHLGTINNDDETEYEYSYYGFGTTFPIAIDGGVEIGLVSKH